ncbi:hypothetical protein [Mycobacteroides abscessus]|uniref:hypothetical protein n=1 Tax=Mycobacteroides abscessus TaxID=36809 RepID=UPI002105008D|nr:hypothetical protein [Mycobacteroides abscessus]
MTSLESRGGVATALHDQDRLNYMLFSRPESLILWERIVNAPMALTRCVQGTEIERGVGLLADVWGKTLLLD